MALNEQKKRSYDSEQNKKRCKAWYEAHKDELDKEAIKAYHTEWYQQNKERISAQGKEYYQRTKDKKKEYAEKNKEAIVARRKKHYQDNKDRILQERKEYQQREKEAIAKRKKEHRQRNLDRIREYDRYRRQRDKEKISIRQKRYREKNKDKLHDYLTAYWKSHAGKVTAYKHNVKRKRELGYNTLNNWFHGSHGHHINYNDVIFIPQRMHISFPHSLKDNKSMKKINQIAIDYLFATEH